MKNKLAAIEGILFSMGTSVTRRQLMEALENWMMLISFVPKQNIMDH